VDDNRKNMRGKAAKNLVPIPAKGYWGRWIARKERGFNKGKGKGLGGAGDHVG